VKTKRGRWGRFAREAVLVLAGLVVLSVAIRLFDLDRRVSANFYHPGVTPPWWAKGRTLWDAVYRYAAWPAFAVALTALALLITSLFRPRLRPHRRALAVAVLSLALGPGLLVNGILKPESGRPRPRNITEFGGVESYRSVGSINLGGKGGAFPSGHASMGFYFLTFYVIWRRSRPRAGRAALAFGLVAGGVIGFQRIAVGAHFLSDVIWAGGVDYLAALFLGALLTGGTPFGRDQNDT
jgi:lipid A 4'-phosphatase